MTTPRTQVARRYGRHPGADGFAWCPGDDVSLQPWRNPLDADQPAWRVLLWRGGRDTRPRNWLPLIVTSLEDV